MLIGDPKNFLHPVQVVGALINYLTSILKKYSDDNKKLLSLGGFLITLIVVFISGISGWFVERLYLSENKFESIIGLTALILLLASSIASKSLIESSLQVIKSIDSSNRNYNIEKAREKLSCIVGRDVKDLEKNEILRAVAETTSENSVDGIFAPIFWILIGISFWGISSNYPGPLTFAFIFKSSSTLDSMIGYREGTLKWIGYSSAKLDDLLIWIPCRLVLITLPLVSRSWYLAPRLIRSACDEGSKDDSPNSGISEAIFAHCLNIRMGGSNTYKNKKVIKNTIAVNEPEADANSIKKIINMILRLEFSWVLSFIAINFIINK